MSIKSKIHDFVSRHGYTYQGFIFSILFFPPAAFYIACKKPDMSRTWRVGMNVVAAVAPPLVGMTTLASLKWMAEAVGWRF